MAKRKKDSPKQGPPVVFRPGAELEQSVSTFAAARNIGINEAFKELAALAVVGLDARYYDVLSQMATQMTGPNAFVRATLNIHAALLGAARVDPRFAHDPFRTKLLIATVQEQVAGMGQTLQPEIAESLLVRVGIQAATVAATTESEEQEFHSTGLSRPKEKQKVPVRRDG